MEYFHIRRLEGKPREVFHVDDLNIHFVGWTMPFCQA